MGEVDIQMAKAVYAILLIGILVFGLFSTSNFVSAIPQDTGKLVPSDKIPTAISPPGYEKAGKTRIIAATTSEDEISNIQQKGCSVIHRLNDATSFFCPSAVVQTLDNVRVARIFQLHDLEADIQIRADRVWNELDINGGGIKVAILDTGVQASHAELSNSVLLTADFTGEGGDNIDSNGHGTHVSGIVTADGVFNISGTNNLATGVSPGAGIIVGKVCKSTGCPEDAIMKGIEWAVAQNADVMNLSLGGGLSFAENCDGDPLADKVNWAVANGVVATISSGNDYSKKGVSFPACASGAIAVGAVDKSDKVARFSNSGPALDIVAPGVSILSTYSCTAVGDCDSTWYAYLSGTSMSSPHAAGVVALMLEKNPTLTVDQVKEALYFTAVDVGRGDGNGRVDAWGAVNYAAPALDTTPPVISNIVTTPSSTSATITWTTDEAATSRTDYGLDTTYGSFVSDPTLVTSHSMELTGLSSSTTYHFKVTSEDSSGNSASSVDRTFTTTSPATVPDAPTALSATVISDSQIDLSWTSPLNDGGSSITGYQIEKASPVGGIFSVIVANTGSTATSYSDAGLSPSTQYNYRVSAINSVGTGPASNEAAATTLAPPTLQSISVTSADTSISIGSTQQYTATGTFSDESTADITSQVTWASSDSLVATIDAAGLASASSEGTTTISATSGVVVGSTTLTVTTQASDVVEITKADYRIRNGDLRVQATSTDFSATLTVVGYGEMKNNGDGTYQFRLRGAIDPGDTITVTSSSGGSATAPVKHR